MTDITYQPQPYVQLQHPEWSKNAVIYQINTRQFTAEGSFAAAEAELPRLSELGVVIVYLMPINPIGEINRKGSLGSPYAVKDYLAVNPELGTLDDLKSFVSSAHKLGMYVIVDWVANHTAWDNPLCEQHPEWYLTDYKGDFRPTPWWDWTDIIDLDYNQPELRRYMTDAMKYWVSEVDIDGYRCDVAGLVPLDFWNNVRRELEEIKPVFMLAEWEERDLHAAAFDASYAWTWYETMQFVMKGIKKMDWLFKYYSDSDCVDSRDAFHMVGVSNHDQNAWEGTEFEVFGEGVEAAIVLSVVGNGIPIIYNGQEAGNPRRLAFFERDPIEWREHAMGALYKSLFALKKCNTALWNGAWGAPMIRVPNNVPQQVLSFVRVNKHDKVFALINLSAAAHKVRCEETLYHGEYADFFADAKVALDEESCIDLPPWGYKVFVA